MQQQPGAKAVTAARIGFGADEADAKILAALMPHLKVQLQDETRSLSSSWRKEYSMVDSPIAIEFAQEMGESCQYLVKFRKGAPGYQARSVAFDKGI